MNIDYIYTEENNCQDCYKCIRECPVKAIKVEGSSAKVIPENCIYCGHCVEVCPAEAKRVKEDISVVKYLLQSKQEVIAALAPSWVSEFPEYSSQEMIGILYRLGFQKVSETALGAEIISEQVAAELARHKHNISISSCCPSAVDLILKYYPQYYKYLLKIDTPMLAHGKYLRQVYGNDIHVVFIGPCIAKKKESDLNPNSIDAVITFKRLREWISELDLSGEASLKYPAQMSPLAFEPHESKQGSLYPVTGGMIAGVKSNLMSRDIAFMSFSGVETINSILKDLDMMEQETPVFLELLSCTEGCINGPGKSCKHSVALKRTRIVKKQAGVEHQTPIQYDFNIRNTYNYGKAVQSNTYPESTIIETLRSIGKQTKEDEMNCGGCGYESCRDFACSVLNGNAERKMCVSYMRRVAQNKATVLLQRMPYGVVIVDKQMRILETNKVFIELAGEEAVKQSEINPGLEGTKLEDIISFHQYFLNLLNSGEYILEKDIKTGTHYLHLSVFTLEGRNQLCGILHNLRAPELNREEIVKRTRKVVRENLETVQKIAFHLGENASKMETLLNSIVDIQSDTYEE